MSSSTVNRAAGHEQAQQDLCTGVSTALTIVSVILVGLRTYSRTVIVRSFGLDDAAMLVALLFAVGYLITIYVLRANGMGFSGTVLTLGQMVNSLKTTLAIQIIYYISVFAIKISILFFYLRIAAEPRFKAVCKGTIYFLSLFCVICIIVCFAQCIPLHKFWDVTGTVQGKCINSTAFFYSTSSFNIITDIWILALPVRTLLKIQRPKREKFALLGIFSLGVFSCIASIVRLHAIRIYTESKDPFYDSVPINLWSMVEVNVGIYCASIPSLKALFSPAQQHRSRSTAQYNYHSKDKNGGQISARILGSGSNSTAKGGLEVDVYDMKTYTGGLQSPQQVARKQFGPGSMSERSGSQEYIIAPGVEGKP